MRSFDVPFLALGRAGGAFAFHVQRPSAGIALPPLVLPHQVVEYALGVGPVRPSMAPSLSSPRFFRSSTEQTPFSARDMAIFWRQSGDAGQLGDRLLDVGGGEGDLHLVPLDLPGHVVRAVGLVHEVHLLGPGLGHDVLLPDLEVLGYLGRGGHFHLDELLNVQLHVLTHLLDAADDLPGEAFRLDLRGHLEVQVDHAAAELGLDDLVRHGGGEGDHVRLDLDQLAFDAQGVLPLVDAVLDLPGRPGFQQHRDLGGPLPVDLADGVGVRDDVQYRLLPFLARFHVLHRFWCSTGTAGCRPAP